MSDEIAIPAGVLEDIRSTLSTGRTALEDTAGSVPGAVDGGDATAALSSILAGAVETASELSAFTAAVRDQVSESEVGMWQTDADSAGAMSGAGGSGGAPVAD